MMKLATVQKKRTKVDRQNRPEEAVENRRLLTRAENLRQCLCTNCSASSACDRTTRNMHQCPLLGLFKVNE